MGDVQRHRRRGRVLTAALLGIVAAWMLGPTSAAIAVTETTAQGPASLGPQPTAPAVSTGSSGSSQPSGGTAGSQDPVAIGAWTAGFFIVGVGAIALDRRRRVR